MFFNLTTFGSAICGAIVGGSIAGFFALKSTTKAHKNQLDLANKNEEKMIKGLLQALHDEIETVYERYQETMGAELESLNEEEPLLMYYPLFSEFFAMYNSNAFLIGRIPENDLRKQIIKTYTLGKGIIDSFRLNNDLIQKFDYWQQLYLYSNNEIHKRKMETCLVSLVKYANKLKASHQQVKVATTSLLRMLRKRGVLSEK